MFRYQGNRKITAYKVSNKNTTLYPHEYSIGLVVENLVKTAEKRQSGASEIYHEIHVVAL